jgi:galactitol-specific phosphotransferase system IIC component
MRAAHVGFDRRINAHALKIEKHEGFFAKVAAVAAIVGAVVTFLAEWAWRKVTS